MAKDLHFFDREIAPISAQPGAESFEILSRLPDLTIVKKRYSLSRETSLVNVFGNYWTALIGSHEDPWVGLWVNGKWETRKGTVVTVFPPFSVARWKFWPGEHEVKVYLSNLPMRPEPSLAVFIAKGSRLPESFKGLVDLIREHEPYFIPVSQSPVSDAVTLLKDRIDSTYQQKENLVEFLRRKSISYEGVAKSFREAYGISPSQYRLKLRLLEARTRILFGESVIDAAFSCGYNNLSLFNRQFLRENQVTPSRLARDPRTKSRPA